MTTLELAVLDLRCACCAEDISEALRSQPGIVRTDVDFPEQRARIEFDESAFDERRIRDLIAERGYRLRTAIGRARAWPTAAQNRPARA